VGPVAVGGVVPAYWTRVTGWSLFVGLFATLAYVSHFSGERPPKDVAYRWDSSILGLVEYAVVLGVVMLLTIGLTRRRSLALRRPTSWWRAVGISALVIFAVFVVGAAVAPFGNPEKEQGLVPERWDPDKLAQFVAFAAVVTVLAPIVEELMFRGVGYGLLERFGRNAAVIGVGLAFALIHGLVAGFPVIATFGIGLAYLRARTDSIYPCILLHASFNAAGLAIGITS
jgi:membrane protease YdiL (CAAX protease family)